MWKVKLDDNIWLAKGKYGFGTTCNESDAWILPNMPTVQKQLKEARRLNPYPKAVVIAAFNDRE